MATKKLANKENNIMANIKFVDCEVPITSQDIERVKQWAWYDKDPYRGQCLLLQCTPQLGVLLEQLTNAYKASAPASVKKSKWTEEKEVITPQEAIRRFGGFSLRISHVTVFEGSPTPEAILRQKNPACPHIWRALKELEFLRPDLIRVTRGGVVRLKGHDPNFDSSASKARKGTVIDPTVLDSLLSQYTREASSAKRNR
jgi:hypothetical protein